MTSALADPNDPDSDALVMLVYNVQDENYYDCSVDTYTAGYFAPEYINEAGMNVIVVDAYDWVNRIGEDVANPQLYEGVIAHELEHLLMNYSDPGEVSWVDEGLADMAIFLNCYDIGGSHLTYHQVFHRETSLTRWGGGLENYGASLTYFLYLWEQAGGNGDGTFNADCQYDGAGGDLLIKLIFENQADGMAGVQAAIDEFNAQDRRGAPVGRGALQGLGHRRQAGRRAVGRLELHQHRLRRPGVHQLERRHRQRPVLEEPWPVLRPRSGGSLGEQPEGAGAERPAVRRVLRDLPQPRAERHPRLRR